MFMKATAGTETVPIAGHSQRIIDHWNKLRSGIVNTSSLILFKTQLINF